MSDTQELIESVCDSIKEMLLDKNRKYGDSALNPLRIFSKCDSEEQIRVRMDDKLSRIKSGQIDDDEDPYDDLIGYLVLLKVERLYQELQVTVQPMIKIADPELEKLLDESEKFSNPWHTGKKDIIITYNPNDSVIWANNAKSIKDVRDQYEDGN